MNDTDNGTYVHSAASVCVCVFELYFVVSCFGVVLCYVWCGVVRLCSDMFVGSCAVSRFVVLWSCG